MNKKAQIKMLESIFVLIMFFFIVAIGLKFYGNIQLQELQKTQSEFERLDSVKISNIIMTLPELACTTDNEFEGSCIDIYKALAWSEINPDFLLDRYVSVFGEARIQIVFLYPQERIEIYDFDDDMVTIYDNVPKDVENIILTEIPIVIKNDRTKTNDFGMLLISTYQRQII